MQVEGVTLPRRGEIYTNLRRLEGHELLGVIETLTVEPRKYIPSSEIQQGQAVGRIVSERASLFSFSLIISFVCLIVPSGLVRQKNTQVAQIISRGSCDESVA
jgi:hypothetical protein